MTEKVCNVSAGRHFPGFSVRFRPLELGVKSGHEQNQENDAVAIEERRVADVILGIQLDLQTLAARFLE